MRKGVRSAPGFMRQAPIAGAALRPFRDARPLSQGSEHPAFEAADTRQFQHQLVTDIERPHARRGAGEDHIPASSEKFAAMC